MKSGDIVNVLTALYGDSFAPAELQHFARELEYCLTAADCALTEIFATALEFETEAGIPDCDSKAWSVFSEITDMLRPCKAAADRLYDCFMHELDDFNIFIKLVTDNAAYLSQDRLQAAIAKGGSLFDRELLKLYGLCDG